MMTKLKLIAFDVTNCLMLFKRTVGREYAEIASMYHPDSVSAADGVRLTKSFESHFPQMSKSYPNYGANHGMTTYQWWTQLVGQTFRGAGFGESLLPERILTNISAHLYRHFGTTECWTLEPGAVDLLNSVKKMHPSIKLGIISNSDERLLQILAAFGILHLFNFVIVSAVVKIQKPDPRIFELALKEAGLSDPDQALFVGNSVEKDYLGAKRCGWNATLLQRTEVEEVLNGVNKSDVIGSLDQLLHHALLK